MDCEDIHLVMERSQQQRLREDIEAASIRTIELDGQNLILVITTPKGDFALSLTRNAIVRLMSEFA